jgi:Family of unknown function (DUF5999)
MCQRQPPCSPADAPDRQAAHTVTSHPEQGWSLLCNGVLLPNGHSIPPRQPVHPKVTARLPQRPRPATARAAAATIAPGGGYGGHAGKGSVAPPPSNASASASAGPAVEEEKLKLYVNLTSPGIAPGVGRDDRLSPGWTGLLA